MTKENRSVVGSRWLNQCTHRYVFAWIVPLEFSLYDSYSQYCCAYIIAYTYIFVDSYFFMLKLLLTIRLSEDIYIFKSWK